MALSTTTLWFAPDCESIFSTSPDCQVVGEASNGREAIDLVRVTALDVLLMDLSMPERGGLDVMASVLAKAPKVRVLILTGHSEARYAVQLIRQGASGFLTKDCDPEEIGKAVRSIARGQRYLTPAVADLMASLLLNPAATAAHENLTMREFQVLLRFAKGESHTDISEQLSLSIKTVTRYRSQVMVKLNLTSNSELTYYALKHELID